MGPDPRREEDPGFGEPEPDYETPDGDGGEDDDLDGP
jgi:hypothetical protein